MIPKIAIVGLGNWSRNMHLPVCEILVDKKLIEVVALCDMNLEYLTKYAERFQAKGFTNFDQMVNEMPLDGVILLLPVGKSEVFIQKSIDYNLPFLCEKPPVNDAKTHAVLSENVKELSHVIAYNRRFSPFAAKTIEWLNGSKVDSIEGLFTRDRRYDDDFTATFIHALDYIMSVVHSPIDEIYVRRSKRDNINNYFLAGRSVNDCSFQLSVLPDAGYDFEKYYIHTKDKSILIEHPFRQGEHGCAKLFSESIVKDEIRGDILDLPAKELYCVNGIYQEYLHFVNVLNNIEQSKSTLKGTLMTQVLREKFLSLSADGGKLIRINCVSA